MSMIKLDNVSMKFNLGIEKNFSLKQFFIDFLSGKKKRNHNFGHYQMLALM